ncbi:MAG: hypothetical protein M1826_002405 [Phylliscum demangeonii]|nr:MAG: hypothetical protein M1826_002405 [Phylliscum demangeonii]
MVPGLMPVFEIFEMPRVRRSWLLNSKSLVSAICVLGTDHSTERDLRDRGNPSSFPRILLVSSTRYLIDRLVPTHESHKPQVK